MGCMGTCSGSGVGDFPRNLLMMRKRNTFLIMGRNQTEVYKNKVKGKRTHVDQDEYLRPPLPRLQNLREDLSSSQHAKRLETPQ